MTDDADNLTALAEAALNERSEGAAVPRLAAWLASHPDDVAVLHWQALLLRELDRREEALDALSRAQLAAPDNAGIAHALAHVSLEAGTPAAALFEVAIALAPTNSAARLGLSAARFAQGDGGTARRELAETLAASPAWLDGHRAYAQLTAMLGEPAAALETIDRALDVFPDQIKLHRTGIGLSLEAERHDEVLDRASRAIAQVGEQSDLLLDRAIALDELGQGGDAADLFARLGTPSDASHAVRLVRHLLRRGSHVQAAEIIGPWLETADAAALWPYAALVWRLLDDPGCRWLEAPGDSVAVIDIAPEAVDLPGLADFLRGLHTRSGRFLDQSVRGGTQTDGNLLARIDPPLAKLRQTLREAVGSYIAALPDVVADLGPAHPLLGQRRDRPTRFAGSWSVQLEAAGHHASHHHPAGWISSAFYVSLPEGLTGNQGWLALGESPADLGLGLKARHLIEPRPGRLVLFPSFMWHATRPFTAGERLTIAFDVARS